jgi:hypothetical protein
VDEELLFTSLEELVKLTVNGTSHETVSDAEKVTFGLANTSMFLVIESLHAPLLLTNVIE